MKPRAVPIVMYHAVGPPRPDWMWGFLVTPLEVFRGQMRRLAGTGWRTISLDELHAHMERGAPLPEKPVILTFDDGYLDNWVYAYPILKRYGLRGAIWVSSDFVDPAPEPRPNLDDVWEGRVRPEALQDRGYLSWEEMRRMVRSGHIEIQSHAKTHTWYFNGPRIVDFHRPRGVEGYVPPPWLGWNAFPDRKFASLTERPEERIPLGAPIYQNVKSLAARRYFDDPGLAERLAAHVASRGGDAFFERPGWRGELEAVVEAYGPRKDRVESDDERRTRLRAELEEPRRAIKEALGAGGDFLCWPGGAHDAALHALAAEVGYRATTAYYDDPVRKNVYGENPAELNRTGCCSPWSWRGKVTIHRTDPGFLTASLGAFAGDAFSGFAVRLYKLKYLLRYCATRQT